MCACVFLSVCFCLCLLVCWFVSVCEKPEAGKRPTLEIRGDCRTIVDWINGHAKLKTRECTVANAQNRLRDWWGGGVHIRQRTAELATDIFREHTKQADLWAEKGAKGHVVECVDTAHVVWSDPRSSVSVGFGDGSCDSGKCGAGIMILACSEALGWFPINKKFGPVLGQNSLDADLGGGGMLADNLCQWIDRCVR